MGNKNSNTQLFQFAFPWLHPRLLSSLKFNSHLGFFCIWPVSFTEFPLCLFYFRIRSKGLLCIGARSRDGISEVTVWRNQRMRIWPLRSREGALQAKGIKRSCEHRGPGYACNRVQGGGTRRGRGQITHSLRGKEKQSSRELSEVPEERNDTSWVRFCIFSLYSE